MPWYTSLFGKKAASAIGTSRTVDKEVDVEIIEPSESPAISISDDSIKILEDKSCSPFNCPLPASSSNWSEPCTSKLCDEEPTSSFTSQMLRSCLKMKPVDSPRSKCVKIEIAENNEVCKVRKTDASTMLFRCKNVDCQQPKEEKKMASCMTESVTKKMVDQSCSAVQDNGGVCVDSAQGICAAHTKATDYHNKLRLALQILQNKDDTIRELEGSLSVAKQRIASLTERATELKRQLDRKNKEIQCLRKELECHCPVEQSDACTAAEEMETQSDIVSTLQKNLSVIEELYRECFYETAKQEDLIDMLRTSYLDLRVMDKRKADQIGRMQTVINTQKWSLDRCQDIALEVDNLKSEIYTFLSSSTSTNNDSGMWERSDESCASVPGVQEELQDITELLLTLRELLTFETTNNLQEENERLKEENKVLEDKIREVCKSECELQQSLVLKDNKEMQYKQQIEIKDQQLESATQELKTLVDESRAKSVRCEKLVVQLRQMQASLAEKSEELERMQQTCDTQQATIVHIREELAKAECVCQKNNQVREEVSYLTAQVAQWRAQLLESEYRVRRLDSKLKQTHACYKEKEKDVAELQAQLQRAHARGAELCAGAARAVRGVRRWARRMRERHRENSKIIEEKNAHIATLQERLKSYTQYEDIDALSSECSSSRQPSCYSKVEARRCTKYCSCQNEMASCSSATSPPRRLCRKNGSCGSKRSSKASCHDVCIQQASQHTVCLDPLDPSVSCSSRSDRTTRAISSPTDELFMRVEQISKAFSDGYRRWSKAEPR